MKIGLRISLKLLRCGATVIVTTRFPRDAARRYAAEADRADWKDRLHLVGADFRDLQGLEVSCFISQLPRCAAASLFCRSSASSSDLWDDTAPPAELRGDLCH